MSQKMIAVPIGVLRKLAFLASLQAEDDQDVLVTKDIITAIDEQEKHLIEEAEKKAFKRAENRRLRLLPSDSQITDQELPPDSA